MSFGMTNQPSATMSKPAMMMNFGDYDQKSLIDLMKMPKFDVLKVYNDGDVQNSNSIFEGGLDTGIDFGKFVIDTSNNITNNQSNIQDRYAEQFMGPYSRTELNDSKLIQDSSN